MARFWKNTVTFNKCISDGVKYTQFYTVKRERFWFFDREDPVQVSGEGTCPDTTIIKSGNSTLSSYQYKKQLKDIQTKKWKTYVCNKDNGEQVLVASTSRRAARVYLRQNCEGRIRRT